jgi:hypothetical protein
VKLVTALVSFTKLRAKRPTARPGLKEPCTKLTRLYQDLPGDGLEKANDAAMLETTAIVLEMPTARRKLEPKSVKPKEGSSASIQAKLGDGAAKKPLKRSLDRDANGKSAKSHR